MSFEDSEPCYIISIAAKMLGMHAQTLRYYERVGMIEPFRSRGNRRLYSMVDIERLRHMKTLMNDLGVNLAGVEVIMKMASRMSEMQKEIEELKQEIRRLSEASY